MARVTRLELATSGVTDRSNNICEAKERLLVK